MSIAFRELENINLTLEERIASITHGESNTVATSFSKKGKRYSDDMRMFVYDAIVNQVPTRNIPILLTKFAQRAAIEVDSVPHRNTVEMMARELGAISDIQVAEVLMHQDNLTLGFDATTQEGVHLNSIHATTKSMCHVIAIDELPGGTAEDYQLHICESIDKLADVYATFHDADYQACRRKIISNIANTMTDRVVVNHAAITRVCKVWGKNLNELNCHLHPLDTIATATKASLTPCEPEKGQLFGKDCIAGNLVLQINKFRYKDGKGDPKGFVTFLDDEGLARGILPRYRGNRLHILFHICGKLFEHHHFFKNGTVSCGGLQQCILRDFDRPTAKVEIQVLGLVGKLLSGPWMTTMYTSAEKQINHVDCIDVVRNVISVIKEYDDHPMSVLTTKKDFFTKDLNTSDTTLRHLQKQPADEPLFCKMMKSSLLAVVTVLLRQYKRYFQMDLTEQLRKETESARAHNIDAEEIIGMFSAAQKRAPNATVCYLSSKLRAQKNMVVDYLDATDEETRERMVRMSVALGRRQRQCNRTKCADMKKELSRRQGLKREKKETSQRKKIEKTLKSTILDIDRDFPDLEEHARSDLQDILSGKAVGRDICHVWIDRESREKTMYNGRMEKMKKKAGGTYVVAYWSQDETYDDAIDYDVSKFELAADFICDELVLS